MTLLSLNKFAMLLTLPFTLGTLFETNAMAEETLYLPAKKIFSISYNNIQLVDADKFDNMAFLYERAIVLDHPSGVWIGGKSVENKRYLIRRFDLTGAKPQDFDIATTFKQEPSYIRSMSSRHLENGNALNILVTTKDTDGVVRRANYFVDKANLSILWQGNYDELYGLFVFNNGNVLYDVQEKILYNADKSKEIGKIPDKLFLQKADGKTQTPVGIPEYTPNFVKLKNHVIFDLSDYVQIVDETGQVKNIPGKMIAGGSPSLSDVATSHGNYFCTMPSNKAKEATKHDGKRTTVTRPRSLNMYYYDEAAGKIYNLGDTSAIAPYIKISEGENDIDETRYQGDVAVVTETGDYYEVQWDKVGINVYHSVANQSVLKKRMEQAISDDKNFVHLQKK
ncbi:MAG: hypothetical protein AABY83_07735 [Pseudomonadota bacterium]